MDSHIDKDGKPTENSRSTGRVQRYGWAISMAMYFSIMAALIVAYPSSSLVAGFLLLALGTFALGGLLGFMFGVPGADPNKPNVTDNRQRTNLELISDWLTKILLGAGLVELKTITEAALNFSKAIGGPLRGDYLLSDFIGLFVILGFGACGVVTGYLWSQLHFEKLKESDGPRNQSNADEN